MKNAYTLLGSLLLSTFAIAQFPAYQYAGPYGNSYNSYQYGIASDANDNVYIGGEFEQANFDLDPGAGSVLVNAGTSHDAFLIKLNSAGTYQWGFNIGGTGTATCYDVDAMSNGTVVAVGYYGGNNIDFDPGPASFPLPSSGGGEGFAACYDAAGNYLWAFSLNGTGQEYVWDVTIDNGGYIYLACEFSSAVTVGSQSFTSFGTSDMLIVKLTPNGTPVNAWHMGGTYSQQAMGIAVDNIGHVIVTGTMSSTVDFDPSGATYNITVSTSQSDMFVASYDTNGTFNWAFNIANGVSLWGEQIAADASGNVFITGASEYTADFDPGSGTNTLVSDSYGDGYLVSYDSTGAHRFGFLIGSPLHIDRIYGVDVDAAGNVYAGGFFSGVNDFDPGPGYDTIRTANYGQANAAFVARYSNTGIHDYAFHFGPTVFNYEARIHVLDVSSNNNVHVSGYVGADCDFDPVGTALVPNNNKLTFIAKYGGSCTPPGNPTAISGSAAVCEGSSNTFSITAVPNAATYNWTLPGGWSGSSTTNSITAIAGSTGGVISVTASNACSTSTASTFTVTVNPLPAVTYSQSPDTFCIPGPMQTLTPGSPAGGSYVGSYIVGNTIDPATLPIDSWYIYYIYTDANGCTAYDSSFVVADICNGIDAAETTFIEIYPNPFGDQLSFTNPSGETVNVEIISSLGEVVDRFVFNGTQHTHNTAKIASGIYFVRLSSPSTTQIETLVK